MNVMQKIYTRLFLGAWGFLSLFCTTESLAQNPNPDLYDNYNLEQLDQRILQMKKGDEINPERIPLPGEKNYDPIIRNNIIHDIVKEAPTNTQLTARTIFQRFSDTRSPVTIANVIIGVVAFIFLVNAAILFFFSDGNPDDLSKARKYVAWIALGLLVVSLAEFVAFRLLDVSREAAEPMLTGDTTIRLLGLKIDQIVNYVEIFITGIMLVLLGLSGYTIITSDDAEEVMGSEKKFLQSFVAGAALILLAEAITMVFSDRHPQDAIFAGSNQVLGIINYVLSFVGVAAFTMLVLAGFYYVSSFGNDDQMNRAKKIILGSVLGIVVALSSYVLVTFMIR